MRKNAAKEIAIGIGLSVVIWLIGIFLSAQYILGTFVEDHKLYYLMLLFPFLAGGAFLLAGRWSYNIFSGRLVTASIVTFFFIGVIGPIRSCAEMLVYIMNKGIIYNNMSLLAYGYLLIPIIAGMIFAVRAANNR